MLCLTATEGRARPGAAGAAATAQAAAPSYARHVPDRTLLYTLVQAHYPDFIARLEAEERSLPKHVHEEFEEYLRCGVLDHGFLRVVCEQCHAERLVAFSCKKRGVCPCCGARRMAESARHLVEEVFGPRPVRQWVLSFPYPLRFLFASKPEAIGAVLAIVHRVIARWLADQAGVTREAAQCGAVTLIQRFGSALNLKIHFHMLWLDGVYEKNVEQPQRKPRLHRTRAPTSAQLTQLADTIANRVCRHLTRKGWLEGEDESRFLSDCASGGDGMDGLWMSLCDGVWQPRPAASRARAPTMHATVPHATLARPNAMRVAGMPYASIGTSAPIFVPSAFPPDPVRPGADYFAIRICGAQVAFVGSIWSKVKSVLVSTQVNLHHPMLGERGLRSLQQARAVKERVDEQMGLAVNLVDLTPAVMPQVTLSIDFHLDKQNRLAQLGSLVNKESFSAALSLAPGGVAIAKVVSALADDIIQTFIPAEEQEPMLQFTGDFNLSTGSLVPGYYVILGTRDEDHPIPTPLPPLEIKDHRLLAGGRPLSGLSYVIIEVRKTSVRSRDLGSGTEWDNRLREAEDIAQSLVDDPLIDNEARQTAWTKCRALLKEAQTFLRAEPSYLRTEAELIVKAAYLRCSELVTNPVLERHGGAATAASAKKVWLPNTSVDRQFLDIASNDTLENDAMAYAEEVMKAHDVLVHWPDRA